MQGPRHFLVGYCQAAISTISFFRGLEGLYIYQLWQKAIYLKFGILVYLSLALVFENTTMIIYIGKLDYI